jgi:hypothetical protein
LRTAAVTILAFFLTIHLAAAQANTRDAAGIPPSILHSIELPAAARQSRLHQMIDKKRVIDKKFVAVMGTLGVAESMRFTTRDLVLENEMAAGAPWVTSIPSHSQLVMKYAPIFAAELAVAYEIKKPHDWLPGDRIIRKFWWAYPAAMTVLHVKNSIGSIRTSAPDTCPAEQCQMQ